MSCGRSRTIGKGIQRDLDPDPLGESTARLTPAPLFAFLSGLSLNFSLTLTWVQPDDLAGE